MKQTHSRPTPVSIAQDSLAYSIRQAAQLVGAVLGGRNLTDAFEHARSRHPEWSDATRGAIRDLAWGCLRDYGRGDLVLSHLLAKPLPIEVKAVLLVSLHRLEVRPTQSHMIVDQAVDAVGSFAPGLKAVVNGVLRNSGRRRAEFEALLDATSVCRFRHPAWWIQRIHKDLPEHWEQSLMAANQRPPMCLRVNRRRADVASVLDSLDAAGLAARPLTQNAILVDTPVPVSRLPGFAAGAVSVQDAGAQWAAPYLDLEAGQRVLDACAAPGGKTAHMLECADVDLLALEIDERRAERVRSNLDRLGLQARIQVADARQSSVWWDGHPFDRILADVPCSASGVTRRHPDIKWLRRSEDIRRFVVQQREILESLWQTLAAGGKMLYVTCSLFREENHAQIEAFCARHADARSLMLDGQPDRQLLPAPEHDGFYYALLEKRG
ncbi:16S rRNA (cytosine(967)-C(5))-methyltransferase RsmB [Rhodocyclaceae bacterium SMB388]